MAVAVSKHKWTFPSRFRTGACSWKASRLAPASSRSCFRNQESRKERSPDWRRGGYPFNSKHPYDILVLPKEGRLILTLAPIPNTSQHITTKNDKRRQFNDSKDRYQRVCRMGRLGLRAGRGREGIDVTRVKVYAWYDNEWGYMNRMMDIAAMVAGSL